MVHSKKQIPITGIANPVNLLDEGGYFRIIGALPRIPEEYIRIHLEQNRLTISATETGSGKKRKMIGLLFEVRREIPRMESLFRPWKNPNPGRS